MATIPAEGDGSDRDELEFDDENDTGAGAANLITAAALAKVAEAYGRLLKGDRIGASTAAKVASEWIRDFGFSFALPSDVLAECVAELEMGDAQES